MFKYAKTSAPLQLVLVPHRRNRVAQAACGTIVANRLAKFIRKQGSVGSDRLQKDR